MLDYKKSEAWTYAKPIKKAETSKVKKGCGCNQKNKKNPY
jgi:hypothetical protein